MNTSHRALGDGYRAFSGVEDTDTNNLFAVISQRDPFPFIGRIWANRASQRKPGILLGNHPPVVKESRKGNR